MSSAHTPGKLTICGAGLRNADGYSEGVYVEGGDGLTVCDFYVYSGEKIVPFPNDRVNAERIVHRHNCHDELLEALEELNEAFDTPGVVNTNWALNFTSDAIAKAKGEAP